ncbi:hypothetical protein ACPB8Q_03760 [Methanocaldococcus indicus]|uniref:hypothetical protein n=1 Tax=Methanocaldococcus indicus TaxID=213231 RepID=UPI003C6D0790
MYENIVENLIKSIKDFKDSNRDVVKIINQLKDVLNNVEKTLEIIECKYYEVIEKDKYNIKLLEDLIKNLENLHNVIENVKSMILSLGANMERNEDSLSKLEKTLEKLKDIDKEKYVLIFGEYNEAMNLITQNKSDLRNLLEKCEVINKRMEELLTEIDNRI